MSGAYTGTLDGQAALFNVTYFVSDEESSYACRGPKLNGGWHQPHDPLALPPYARRRAAAAYRDSMPTSMCCG